MISHGNISGEIIMAFGTIRTLNGEEIASEETRENHETESTEPTFDGHESDEGSSKESSEIQNNDEDTEDVQNQKTREPNMVTIDRTKAENFLIAIAECLENVQAQKEIVDKLVEVQQGGLENFKKDTITKFNAIVEATTDLKEKIVVAGNYQDYLAEQVKNANLQKDVVMLQQQLDKEKAEISQFLIKVDSFLTLKISELETKVNELRNADDIIENNIKKFKEELKSEATKHVDSIDNIVETSANSLVDGAKNQMAGLKAECNEMLKKYTEKCQSHLETVKKQSIDFLKQCENENKKLIEKVPAVANSKISKKDIVIYAMAGVSIASLLVQMFV